ncbi:ADP-ribosylation factor-like protein 6 [Globomyces pollinis-pini]|nr:ADP-ribosylation factor-like protein 6 [Globomyces pollinis-pini]
MGILENWLVQIGLRKPQFNILCLGLDNAGKTSLLHQLRSRMSLSDPIPTVGLEVQRVSYKNLILTFVDMSGQGSYRNLWQLYFNSSNAIIFVIDGTDKERMSVVHDELENIVNFKSTKNSPIVFFVNKMDLSTCISPSECVEILGINRIKDRNWTIFACSALTGDGISDGMMWLTDELIKSTK